MLSDQAKEKFLCAKVFWDAHFDLALKPRLELPFQSQQPWAMTCPLLHCRRTSSSKRGSFDTDHDHNI